MIAAVLPLALVLLGAWLARSLLRLPLAAAPIVLTAPALGFGAASFAFFWLRLPSGPSDSFAAVFAGLCLLALALMRWKPLRALPPPARGRHDDSLLLRLGVLVFAAGGALAVWLFQLYRLAWPLGTTDAWAIWNQRALLLLRLEEPVASAFPHLSYGHPSYPLFLPSGLAAQLALLPEESVLLPAVQSLVFTLACAGAIWSGLRLLGVGRWGPWAAVLFLMIPNVQRRGFSQCADIVVAYVFACAGVLLATLLRDDAEWRPPAWLAGFFLGLLPWTKNEGLLLAVALFGPWWLCRWTLERTRRPPVTAIVLGALPGLASLAAFKLFWYGKSELAVFARGALGRAVDPERWRLIPAAFLDELNPSAGGAEWGLLWPLLAGLALVGGRSWLARAELRFLGLALALAFLIWFGVYLGTVNEIAWHLKTSLDRLLLQLVPLALVAVFAAAAARSTDPTATDAR